MKSLFQLPCSNSKQSLKIKTKLHFYLKAQLSRPRRCPLNIYKLMLKCWHRKEEKRPTFRDILFQMIAWKQKSWDCDVTKPEHPPIPLPRNATKQKTWSFKLLLDEETWIKTWMSHIFWIWSLLLFYKCYICSYFSLSKTKKWLENK